MYILCTLCTFMYMYMCAHLYILLCFGSLRDPPTPSCTKVYFILLCFGRKFDHPPPKIENGRYFCTEKFLKNWVNFRLFSPNLTYFLQFFGNFYENFVQKYQLYFCDFGKNVDTHPWLYKSTLYTFVFLVPSRPTPPHTRRVLLYLPPGERLENI